jgi:hypothetical protein
MPNKDVKLEEIAEKLLRELPREVIRLVCSDDLIQRLADICFRCGIVDKVKLEKIGFEVTNVLLGKLPPENLLEVFRKQIEVPPITAKRLFDEIDAQIFLTVREGLNKMYGQKDEEETKTEGVKEKGKKEKEIKETEAEEIKTKKSDPYREPIES